MSRDFGTCGEITVVGVSGDLTKLSPDLSYPSTKAGASNVTTITPIDTTGGLTTMLSLTGKYAVSFLLLSQLASENITVKLTVDGVVIWDDTYANTATTSSVFLGSSSSLSSIGSDSIIACATDLLFEVQTITASSVLFQFIARPIL